METKLPLFEWPDTDTRFGFAPGDRIEITNADYIKPSLLGVEATVCAFRDDDGDLVGILFDDEIGYPHDCDGYGIEYRSAWIPYNHIDHVSTRYSLGDVLSFVS